MENKIVEREQRKLGILPVQSHWFDGEIATLLRLNHLKKMQLQLGLDILKGESAKLKKEEEKLSKQLL